MTPDAFILNFDLFAEAPGGVSKLREMILQLAIRGKLVPQDPTDRPVEIDDLPASDSIKSEVLVPTFHIPPGWIWTRLGYVVDYNYGEKTDSQRIPADAWLLDLEDIEKNTSRLLQRVMARDRQSKSIKTRFSAGAVLYGKLRPYLNKVLVADRDGYCTTEIVPLKPLKGVDPGYIVCTLKSRDFLDYAAMCAYGMKMPRLGTDDAKKAPFPLPPLAEQKRIVARVNELMKRCDEVEARQKERNDRRTDLTASCFHAFASIPEIRNVKPETTRALARVLDNFPLLLDTPESLSELRKNILQLAVGGKLVRQDPRDEPAGAGLNKIASPDYIPYYVPEGWRWTTLRSVSFDHGQKVPVNRFTYIDVSAIDKDHGKIGEGVQILRPENAPSRARKIVKVGTVIYSTVRPYLLNIAVVDREFDPEPIASTAFFVMHPFACVVSRFLFYYLRSQPFTEYVNEAMTGMAYPAVNDAKMSVGPFPLPPLSEQKRIVAKINNLMALCDALEAKMTKARDDADTLTAAVVHYLCNSVTGTKKDVSA